MVGIQSMQLTAREAVGDMPMGDAVFGTPDFFLKQLHAFER